MLAFIFGWKLQPATTHAEEVFIEKDKEAEYLDDFDNGHGHKFSSKKSKILFHDRSNQGEEVKCSLSMFNIPKEHSS